MSDFVDLPVKDRMKTFLFNEEMADVYFLVGTEEVQERIPAYKIILATASEVFHGQLYGRFDVPEPIKVVDTTPETFKTMLVYIYTDEVVLTPENAFPVLYLAKKYMLSNLVTQILNYVATAYSGQSVAKVLPHMHLMDGEIAESVWDTIDQHADVVLKSQEFLELSHAALCELLRRDLDIDEVTVYNSTLAWTQAECDRKQQSFETDAREVLGNALKLVRFPLMSIEEFARGPAKTGLLSDQEKLEVYSWYGLHASKELETFSSAPRKGALLSCNRFEASSIVNYNGGSWPNTREHGQWFFGFKVGTRVRVHGIAFYGRKDESNIYEVDLELLNAKSGVTLATTHAKVTTVVSQDTYKVFFDQPVPIEPDTQYKVRALSIGPKSMFAQNGLREVTCYGSSTVTFEFIDTGRQHSGQYDVALRSHIPIIYFSFP